MLVRGQMTYKCGVGPPAEGLPAAQTQGSSAPGRPFCREGRVASHLLVRLSSQKEAQD